MYSTTGTGKLNKVCVASCPFCSGSRQLTYVEVDGVVASAARRRQERRLRSWWRHERQTFRLALLAAAHHSYDKVAAGEENCAPWKQTTDRARSLLHWSTASTTAHHCLWKLRRWFSLERHVRAWRSRLLWNFRDSRPQRPRPWTPKLSPNFLDSFRDDFRNMFSCTAQCSVRRWMHAFLRQSTKGLTETFDTTQWSRPCGRSRAPDCRHDAVRTLVRTSLWSLAQKVSLGTCKRLFVGFGGSQPHRASLVLTYTERGSSSTSSEPEIFRVVME